MITKKMKIHSIITKYPDVKAVLLQISPKFSKLNNPLMLKTMGKIASVEDAAKIAGVPVNEVLMILNKAIGFDFNTEIKEDEKTGNKDNQEFKMPTEQMEWHLIKEEFIKVDVREVEDPFPIIMKLATETLINQGFCIIQKFEPVPLYNVLGNKGYQHLTEKISENEYHAYFYRLEIPL